MTPCTFGRDGVVCGRPATDKTVHVDEDERMRRGAHVWRHEPRSSRSPHPRTEYRRGYDAGYQAGRRAALHHKDVTA